MARRPPFEPASASEVKSLRSWLQELAAAIVATDYERARKGYVSEGFTEFATVSGGLLRGLDETQSGQWEHVWPYTTKVEFEEPFEAIVSLEGRAAVVAVIWKMFAKTLRVSRVTFVFVRSDVNLPWLCAHAHFSLVPAAS